MGDVLDNEVSGIDDFRSWLSRINALSALILDAQSEVDELSIKRHFAVAEDNKRAQVKLEGESRKAQAKLAIMVRTMNDWTGCATLDELHQVITDAKVRIGNAYELYESWRKYCAYLELAESARTFPEGLTPSDCRATAETLQAEFELQMALLRKFVASRGGVRS